MNSLRECRDFFRECWQNFHDTGSVIPSSRFLARELVSEFRKAAGPARVLEVGPGTGAVTAEILAHLRAGDQLDLIELNPRFVAILRERFQSEARFQPFQDRVKITNAPVQELDGTGPYDYIISGLPLNNFAIGTIESIYRVFVRLLGQGGMLSYFEYALVRHLKKPFVSRPERVRLSEVGRVTGEFVRSHQVRQKLVMMNCPPAIVRHLSIRAEASANGAGQTDGNDTAFASG